ncbi:fructokinase [Cloacibacterium rupense]|uniref:Fructokinase n=1 Tax=Cloacibacterium rupense TaxID=517423 RepID=A0ABQ2NK57_9FLAO|nr:carbohydrate kinase [Cloacibacterium rupense]GGP05391.1 fructokinase [Cloacibacterium rupense]
MKKAVCFGEVLWDVFPEYKVAGGAPMNVAFRLKSMGWEAEMISKIGEDDLGKELLPIIEKNIGTKFIQIDKKIPTGIVAVTLDEQKNASYKIVFPSAWDFIEVNDEVMNLVEDADVFIFGSLVCRNDFSKNSLLKLIEKSKFSVFDVNLRAPHYDLDFILDLIKKSSLVKMNDDELVVLAHHFQFPETDLQKNVLELAKITGVKTFCITRGKDGAVFYTNEKFYEHLGFEVKVQDTVGSGDSFLAALLSKISEKETPEKSLEFACAVGAMVATKKGANETVTPKEIENLKKTKK